MSSLRGDPVPDQERDEVSNLLLAGGLSVSDIKADGRLREVLADCGKRSLYFLVKAILGYSALTLRTHKPICDVIQDTTRKRVLVLLPRGCFKTTIGTIGFIIWLLINDPNRRIILANQTTRNAERMLLEIEQHLQGSNEMVNWLYPWIIRPGEKWKPWSSVEMTVPGRDIISGMPSVSTIGVGTRAESMHAEWEIHDDLVGLEDMFSEVNMYSAATWHEYALSLFTEPGQGWERIYGTRWPGDGPLYGKLIDSGDYEVIWKPARDEETGELFFPERLGEDALRRIRDKNYVLYMYNYMNKAVGIGTSDFNKNDLRYYWLVETKQGPGCKLPDGTVYLVKDGDVVIAVDPAGSGDTDRSTISEVRSQSSIRKSNNAVCVWMAHPSGLLFQLYSWAGRAHGENPELQIAKKMLEVARDWYGYARTGVVEAYGAQAGLITIYNMLCRESNFHFKFEETPRGIKTAKKVRIRGTLGGPAGNGQVYVRKNQDQFIEEYAQFPHGEMMDTLDAATWAVMSLRQQPTIAQRSTAKEVLAKRAMRRIKFITRAGY